MSYAVESLALLVAGTGVAGRDAAIAAALDELVQAASARSEDPVGGGSGTRVARTGQRGRKGHRR